MRCEMYVLELLFVEPADMKLRSLRSSGRRRLVALRDLEMFLVNGCGGEGLSSADFVAQKGKPAQHRR